MGRLIIISALLCALISFTYSQEFEDTTKSSVEDTVVYATPKTPADSYIAETFDDIISFEKVWIKSQAKKDGVDANIAKYDGVWSVEQAKVDPLKGDRSLVLKTKAKHAAISAPLSRPFKFGGKPLVVQYEVTLQDGQECGGAYMKLLSQVEGTPSKLQDFQDKTPYTIMFGPDNCGNDYKLHFIFRHVNPLNGSVEEKHANKGTTKLETFFKDKKPHLYTLILRPENTYELQVDHNIISSGSLLEDVSPPVNPPKEIADPRDSKPAEWDEREQISDPDDKQPEDWDESAPQKIADLSATIPSGWLEDEPEMIDDPEATKPDDWDPDMDGDWEAPLIDNPACKDLVGCGPWSRPMIDNPAYKGKWFQRKIANPNYKGQWLPKMIANPDYFDDLEPFKMTPIIAVGFELWSMSGDILFDNILITDNTNEAEAFAADTFDIKISHLKQGHGNIWEQFVEYSSANPWLYAVYVIAGAIVAVLVIIFCCVSGTEKTDPKKTDAETPGDEVRSEDIPEEEEEEEVQEEEQQMETSHEEQAEQEEQAVQEVNDEEEEGDEAELVENLQEEQNVVEDKSSADESATQSSQDEDASSQEEEEEDSKSEEVEQKEEPAVRARPRRRARKD